ncbi:uncharacterized protein LOC121404486 [Drosophila obscura]|uniref:uncharacterized protein LOC121404486 n=1 Tax=Drosophila obscura TaxID=7282 RepID=UPI001BB13C63|nr:uncharacterized protein LOC121404486 [Drosophila obscura]
MSDTEIHHVANEAPPQLEDDDAAKLGEVRAGSDEHGGSRRSTSARPKSKGNFCCIAKEYYSDYSNLIDSLHIMPRLMIHHRGFKINSTYGLTLNIRNSGLVGDQPTYTQKNRGHKI